MIATSVDFCPSCGKHVGADSVTDEYCPACDEAEENDPTFLEPDDEDKLEAFGIEFLTNL